MLTIAAPASLSSHFLLEVNLSSPKGLKVELAPLASLAVIATANVFKTGRLP